MSVKGPWLPASTLCVTHSCHSWLGHLPWHRGQTSGLSATLSSSSHLLGLAFFLDNKSFLGLFYQIRLESFYSQWKPVCSLYLWTIMKMLEIYHRIFIWKRGGHRNRQTCSLMLPRGSSESFSSDLGSFHKLYFRPMIKTLCKLS